MPTGFTELSLDSHFVIELVYGFRIDKNVIIFYAGKVGMQCNVPNGVESLRLGFDRQLIMTV